MLSIDSTLITIELPDGSLPLHYAAAHGYVDLLECVLDHGALENCRQHLAKTPLHEAANHDQVECAKILLKHDVLVDSHTTRGRTPLMYAARSGSLQVLKLLIENQANVNEKDDDGITALHLSSMVGQLEAAKCLVELGAATVDVQSNVERTPLLTALSHSQVLVAEYLLNKGASMNASDSSGVTVWHEVAKTGCCVGFQLLVRHFGGIPNELNIRDAIAARHPLHYAAIEGHQNMIEEMMTYMAKKCISIPIKTAKKNLL